MSKENNVWCVDVNDINMPETIYFDSLSEAIQYKVAMETRTVGKSYNCSVPYISNIEKLVESMTKSEQAKFYDRLRKEKVHFQYKKKDGSLRKAFGTLIALELPEPKHSSDTKASARDKMKRSFPDDSVFYFDLDKKKFRSFKIQLFDKYL